MLVKRAKDQGQEEEDTERGSPTFCDKGFICSFSCRYNPLWLYFHSPVAGFSLLVFEVS